MSENLFIDYVDTGNSKAIFKILSMYISWLVHELSPIQF